MIGAVELGADFGPIFLDYINRTCPGKWGIYTLKRGVRSIDDTHLVAFFGGDKDKSAGTNFRNDCNPIFIRSVASKQVGSKRMNEPSWRSRAPARHRYQEEAVADGVATTSGRRRRCTARQYSC